MSRRQSPIKRVCRRGAFKIKLCQWTCDEADLRVAQFRATRAPDRFAVVHPATKIKGNWQVSVFDEQGAIRDVSRTSCAAAMSDAGLAHGWKLEHVVSKKHGQLAGRRR